MRYEDETQLVHCAVRNGGKKNCLLYVYP